MRKGKRTPETGTLDCQQTAPVSSWQIIMSQSRSIVTYKELSPPTLEKAYKKIKIVLISVQNHQ